MSGRKLSWFVLGSLLLIPVLALTQDAPQGQDQGRRRGDPAQMRERMMNNVKEQMGVNEDEWKALAPKVEKVVTLQHELRSASGMGGFGGGPGGRGEAGDQPPTKLAQAQRDLRTALENKDTPAPDIAKRLADFREARDKVRAEFETAQKALKAGITPRQEAVLVMTGLLD